MMTIIIPVGLMVHLLDLYTFKSKSFYLMSFVFPRFSKGICIHSLTLVSNGLIISLQVILGGILCQTRVWPVSHFANYSGK